MKQFFKFVLASMLGFILVMGILFFISIGMLFYILSTTEQEEVYLTENTVIKMDFKNPIPERTAPVGFITELYAGSIKRTLGLNDILNNIQDAAKDQNVKGILLDLSIVPSGISTLEEIRNELEKFKESGKFILCYGEYMSQGAYYLGSVADEIYVHPEGFIDFKGLNAQVMFVKGMLDKLDINMQIVRHGKFKSAVEPLIQEKMSPENREQYSVFINSIWSAMLDDISQSRGLGIGELNDIANGLLAYDADDALSFGLVDDILYRDGYRRKLAINMKIEEYDDINIVSLGEYDRVYKAVSTSANKIAVIYATGQIVSGRGDNERIGADYFAKTIASLAKDENVKAVVLRVNSPGGDALASDIIWRELELLQVKVPIIVSMGDVAASGGYWISCASHTILADPTTLTGSIGVFGVIPDIGEFMDNKLGITYDNVGTNQYSGFPSIVKPLSSFERNVLQNKVEGVYDMFLHRVSNNRDLTKEEVDEIGQGRIWSGIDAKRLGLVDELGGLQDAIRLASEISDLDEYVVIELPYLKDPIDQLIEQITSGVSARVFSAEIGPFYEEYKQLKSIIELKGVQALMPYHVQID